MSAAGRLAAGALSFPALSRLAGALADARLPGPLLRAAIRAFVRAYRVDLAEAADPLDSFGSFDAFFTRRLREGVRPVDARPGLLCSPADARLQTCGPIGPDGRLEQIKGLHYELGALLGSAAEAERFRGGHHAVFYLSPTDYHRVHAPCTGAVARWRYLPGRLYPVNGLAVRNVPGLFAVNERVVVQLESPELGLLAVVLVGATNVGRMTLSFVPGFATNVGQPAREERPEPRPTLGRGDELGVFHLGSTVVLLSETPLELLPGVVVGQKVKVGQAVARRA